MSEKEFWIKLLVKFKGKCAVCGKEIPAGEYALWSKASKAIKHVKCKTMQEASPAVKELECFVCDKAAGCVACGFETDCDRSAVSQACICEECFSDKNAYPNYQQAFLERMAKLKWKGEGR